MRNFKDELQDLLQEKGTSWADAADKLGKERNNVRRNTRRWIALSETVLNALGFTIQFERLVRKKAAKKTAKKSVKTVKKKPVIKKAVIKKAVKRKIKTARKIRK